MNSDTRPRRNSEPRMVRGVCDVCSEPIQAEEGSRPLCMEHLFTEEFPALAALTDQVGA